MFTRWRGEGAMHRNINLPSRTGQPRQGHMERLGFVVGLIGTLQRWLERI